MTDTDNYLQIHQYRLDYILAQIHSLHLSTQSTILDVGCYPPYLFDNLKDKYTTFGISSPLEPITQKNIITLDIEKDPLTFSTKFDLIIFTEIIEHLTDPYLVIKKLELLLKPSGYLLITTPNVNRWQNLFLQLFNKNIYFPLFQLSQPINFRHQREYTMPELLSIGTFLKLKIKNFKFFVAYPPFRDKNKTDKFTFKIMKYFIYYLEKIFPSRADNLLAIFQK